MAGVVALVALVWWVKVGSVAAAKVVATGDAPSQAWAPAAEDHALKYLSNHKSSLAERRESPMIGALSIQ